MDDTRGTLRLPAREIPVPTSVSVTAGMVVALRY